MLHVFVAFNKKRFIFKLIALDWTSPCSPDWTGTPGADEAGLKSHGNLPASDSPVLRLKAFVHHVRALYSFGAVFTLFTFYLFIGNFTSRTAATLASPGPSTSAAPSCSVPSKGKLK